MIARRCTRLGSTARRLFCDAAYAGPAQAQREASPGAAQGQGEGLDEERPPLMDALGRRHDYLRLSLTERCNLRCQYCMPAGGVPLTPRSELLTSRELTRLVRVFSACGVSRVRLTGGEPTLRTDLPELIAAIKALPRPPQVSMTSNGLVLARRLLALQRAGLAALNLSLDSLRPERYERLTRRRALPQALAALDVALQLQMPLKLNVVLMKGFNDDEILDFVELTRSRALELRFIEFMPFGGNQWGKDRLVPYRDALRVISGAVGPLQPLAPRPNATARLWRVPGHQGTVGFIASMTQPFCSSCNRLRVTADGNLKVCLFGAAEVSLRDAMRTGASDAQLERLIRDALLRKQPQHAATRARPGTPSRDHRVTSLLSRDYRVTSLVSRDRRVTTRGYCTLSHVDAAGRARMVDVGDKAVTSRRAAARCRVRVSRDLMRQLRDNALRKGDALCVAQVAGVQAAKRAADLLPLCHPLPLEHVHVQLTLDEDEGCVVVECSVRCRARTGAEMEALTGCAVAALALYDMGKAVDKRIVIADLALVSKSGGKTDYPPSPPPPRDDAAD